MDNILLLEGNGVSYKVIKAEIVQKLNEHASLKASVLWGMPDNADTVKCMDMVTLKEYRDETEKVVFSGVITGILIQREEGREHAVITLKSGSALLDCKKKYRSFQKESRTYGELLQLLLQPYPSGSYIWNGDEKRYENRHDAASISGNGLGIYEEAGIHSSFISDSGNGSAGSEAVYRNAEKP